MRLGLCTIGLMIALSLPSTVRAGDPTPSSLPASDPLQKRVELVADGLTDGLIHGGAIKVVAGAWPTEEMSWGAQARFNESQAVTLGGEDYGLARGQKPAFGTRAHTAGPALVSVLAKLTASEAFGGVTSAGDTQRLFESIVRTLGQARAITSRAPDGVLTNGRHLTAFTFIGGGKFVTFVVVEGVRVIGPVHASSVDFMKELRQGQLIDPMLP